MLTAYIEAALRRAVFEVIENGDYSHYAEIPELPGVWAVGRDDEDLRRELREVLESWLLYCLSRQLPLPNLDGISLSEFAVA